MTRFTPLGALGFGGAPIGNLFAALTEPDADEVLEAAWNLGIRYYDTAPLYGLGLSEHRIGRSLRQRPRDSFVLSTKVGRLLHADPAAPTEQYGFVNALNYRVHFDYSASATQRSIEDSLQRLGLAALDIVLIHDVGEDTHGPSWPQRFAEAMRGAAPVLTRLREQGTIRAWGLGVNSVEPCRLALQQADPDLFLLAGRYTLLDHAAALTLLPACAARDVKLIIGGPYNSGLLAGGTTFDYVPADPRILARRDLIAAVCETHGVPLKAAALQFAAAPTVVSCVIPGGRNVREVTDNAELMAQALPEDLWRDLKRQGLVAADAQTPGSDQERRARASQ